MSEPSQRPPCEPLVQDGGIEHHIADFTATISSTMTLAAAQAKLAEFDQWIPIDGDPGLPIGKLVEQNSTGPLRLGYGAWRDLLLGMQFRTHGGAFITAGGRTVKNVAGYDLTKFMVGNARLLGSIVTVTTRTYKTPPGALCAEFLPSDRWIGKIIATPLRPRWALLRQDVLTCGWHDEERALSLFEGLAAEHHPLKIFRQSLADDIALRARLWKIPGNSFRASVPPSRILQFTESAKIQDWSADAAFGIVIGPCEPKNAAWIQASAREVGGSAIIFTEGESPKWEQTGPEAVLLESLKKAFVSVG